MSNKCSRPFLVWLLIIMHFFMGFGGVVSGGGLILSPDGKLLGMTVSILEGSPFPDYLIPGIVLFLFVGLYSVFAGISLLKLPVWICPDAVNPVKRYHWAWSASWASGVIMIIWIAVETIMLGYISFLQPFIFVWAVILILLTVLSPVRRYCIRNN